MRKAVLLAFIAAFLLAFTAAFAPQAAAVGKGGIKVINSIPDTYWGTWVPGGASCKEEDSEAIVLSAKAYTGSLGKCDVVSVSETPSPKGATYSARLQCADPRHAQKKAPANLIIRVGEANRISIGPEFNSLKTYQRCSESTPASKP